MYGLLQQLRTLVLGEERERERSEPQVSRLPAPQPQKRFFTGEITSLSDTSGMIDHQVRLLASSQLSLLKDHVTSRDAPVGFLHSECGDGWSNRTGVASCQFLQRLIY